MLRRSLLRLEAASRPLRRNMAGHGFDDGVHPPPNAAGRVQEVLRIGGVYFGLIALAMFFPSGSKKKSDKLAAAPAPVPSSSGDVPSVEAPEFGDWISVPGNAEKFFQQ